MYYNYFAVQAQKNGLYFCYVERVSSNQNIKHKFDDDGIEFVLLAKTKKQAHEIVNLWNQSYKEQGRHLHYKSA